MLDRNFFGIRRRRPKVTEKIIQLDNIETAKDALEDMQSESIPLQSITQSSVETAPKNIIGMVKYAICVFFGVIGCYLSYKFIPIYLVSLN